MKNIFFGKKYRAAALLMAALVCVQDTPAYGMTGADAITLMSETKTAKAVAAKASTAEAAAEFNRLSEEMAFYGLIFDTDGYALRKGPSVGESGCDVVKSGDWAHITQPERDENGDLWFKVEVNGSKGYIPASKVAVDDERLLEWMDRFCGAGGETGSVSADNVPTVSENAISDADGGYSESEASVDGVDDAVYNAVTYDSNGVDKFPGLYQTKLNKLAAAHPNWKFVAYDTDVKWSDAVKAERGKDSKGDYYSLIEGSADSKYVDKSSPQGGIWYVATKAGVEYYMDPRNFLDATHVFMFENMTYNSSYQTEDAVQDMFSSTFMKGNLPDKSSQTYAEAFVEIGEDLKASPLHLGARVIQEQGSSGSDMVSGTWSGEDGKYKGYYNFFNIKATGTGTTAIKNGLAYAKEQGWNTRYKSIKGGARSLAENYIQAGQNTLYFEKWDFIGSLYTHQYMQNIRAPYFEAERLKKIYSNTGVMDKAFVFRIPVFDEMPGSMGGVDLTPVTGISFAESTVEIKTGQSFTQRAEYEPVATSDDVTTITYTSSKPAVAAVTSEGDVTGVSAGSATITAKFTGESGTFTATYTVKVSDCSVKYYDNSGTLKKTLTCSVGKTFAEVPYSATAVFAGGGERSGYAFSGWYSLPDGEGLALAEDYVITDDISAYPYYIDLSKGFSVREIGSYCYTGSLIKPRLEVYDKDKLLIQGRDYTVEYKRNRNASKSSLAYALVAGKGNYKGTQRVEFRITQRPLTDAKVTAKGPINVYTGKNIYGSPVVKYNGTLLKKGEDYTLSYPKKSETGAYRVPGVFPITISGKGNFTGSITVYQTISEMISLSKCKITGVNNRSYTGEPVAVAPMVTYKGQRLYEGEHYTVTCPSDMTSAGKKTITIKGIESAGFSGRKNVSFTVRGIAMKGATVEGAKNLSYIPDGKFRTYTQEGYEVFDRYGTRLTEGEDYTVSYKNNTAVGTASMVITGIGEYTGSVTKKYKITGCQLTTENENADIKVLPGGGATDFTWYYEKTGSLMPVKVYAYGMLLRSGTDYKITYRNNKKIGTGQYTITGKGLFAGKLTGDFEIVEQEVPEGEQLITKAKFKSLTEHVYNGTEITLTGSDISLTLLGEDLKEGEDYEFIPGTYWNNIQSGTASVYVRGIGEYGGVKKITYKITPFAIKWWWKGV